MGRFAPLVLNFDTSPPFPRKDAKYIHLEIEKK